MTKPNLGKKRTCLSCEARFFDLNKNPAICPKCGEEYKLPVTKVKKTSQPDQKNENVEAAKVDPLAKETQVDDFTTELDDSDIEDEDDALEAELEDDMDDSLMENTSDLDEGGDELSEVFENVKSDDTEKL